MTQDSKRERGRKILAMLEEGQTRKQIAESLRLSTGYVGLLTATAMALERRAYPATEADQVRELCYLIDHPDDVVSALRHADQIRQALRLIRTWAISGTLQEMPVIEHCEKALQWPSATP